MYIIFFLLLAGLSYGSVLTHFKVQNPVILVLGIIGTLMLMLVPVGEDIVFSTNTTIEVNSGAQAITETHVLFTLVEGYEYTAWIWIHIALLVTQMVFLFAYMMGKMA
jgi:hypothetical protein